MVPGLGRRPLLPQPALPSRASPAVPVLPREREGAAQPGATSRHSDRRGAA